MGRYPTGMFIVSKPQGRLRVAMSSSSLLWIVVCVVAWLGALGGSAKAVVNSHIDVMQTDVDPDDYIPPTTTTSGWPVVPDWTQGDPGWDNVTISGSNYVYLGDNWVLTARHIAAPSTVTFSTGSFSRVSSQNFVVRNPPPSLANGASLTTETDLRLFRINGNVGLPALTIASESPPLTGNSGSQVMFIGRGRVRKPTETHWSMNPSSPPPTNEWSDAEVTTGGNVHGYKTCAPPETCVFIKRWGTNRLENPSSSAFESDVFDETISPTTAVLPLFTQGDGVTRDIISMVTTFNPQSDASALPFESQAVASDSGGAVFYNRGTEASPDWVLSGIVNATITLDNQPASYALYGNSTTFADLSYYNLPYQRSICDIMKACGAYSVMGDVNLDGNVTGNGTGPTSSDDVSALVSGWGDDNFEGRGDYATWTKGDLNLDGATDVDDFLLLRSALHGPISSDVMTSLFGAVPEPSSVALAALAGAFLAITARRRAAN